MEPSERIEILDTGSEEDFLLGPDAFCCMGAFGMLFG